MTIHSHLLSEDELTHMADTFDIKVVAFFLHEFDTELDFSNKIGWVLHMHINYVFMHALWIMFDYQQETTYLIDKFNNSQGCN